MVVGLHNDRQGRLPAASFPYEHSERLENGLVVYKFLSPENLSQDIA